MTDIILEGDDGTAEWAAGQAAGLIGRAFYRASQDPNEDASAMMLDLATEARSHITKTDWARLGGVS